MHDLSIKWRLCVQSLLHGVRYICVPCFGAILKAPEMHCLPSKQVHIVTRVFLLQMEAQAMHLGVLHAISSFCSAACRHDVCMARVGKGASVL